MRSVTGRALPVSNVDRHQVVKVQATPLLYIRRARGTEERPAYFWSATGQKHCGQLLSEACFTSFKQLIRLINDQPLHTEQHKTKVGLRSFWLIFMLMVVTEKKSHRRRWNVTCWGRELEDPDWEGRWVCLEYWRVYLNREILLALKSDFNSNLWERISYRISCSIVVRTSWLPGKLCLWCEL